MSKSEDYRVSYAQNREDIILEGFFDGIDNGFYVDIGANDPDIDSVTKKFYDKGWKGINVEPQKKHYDALKEKRSRDITLNIGVGEREGELKLRQYEGDGLSTLSEEMKAENALQHDDSVDRYEDIVVNIRTLESIFKDNKISTIQFMKVDVEGFEYEVLVSNNWSKYRPEIICIEANHVKRDWHPLLVDNDYELVFFDGLNEYFGDKKQSKRRGPFSYVKSVVLGRAIVPSSVAQLIDAQEDRIDYLVNEGVKKEAVIRGQQREIESITVHAQHLQNELNEIMSLKSHIIKYTKKKIKAVDVKVETRLQGQGDFVPAVKVKSYHSVLDEVREIDIANRKGFYETHHSPAPLRAYRKSKRLVKRTVKVGR